MLERYSKQIILKEIGQKGQEKINLASVLIVGCGGLGSAIALYLAAAGVGRIGLIDGDIITISNLNRQILYDENDLELWKVERAKKKILQLNSNLIVDIYKTKLNPENAVSIVGNYDVIVDGCDNYQTRYLMNDVCVELGKPYVYGAIDEYSGQVSVFNYKGGANYRDLYPNENVFKAQSGGVIGALPGVIGCIEANETIKIIINNENVLSNKLFTIDLLTMETFTVNINN